MSKAKVQRGTTKRQQFSCGVGSFCNDLINKVMLSFILVFCLKVANLSSKQAGLVTIGGQAANFVANFLFGYCCDHVDVPLLSRVHGRRKTWHLIGTIFTVTFFVLSFSRCLLCPQPPSKNSWLGFSYFAVTYSTSCFWWGAVDVAHLSLIPEIAQTQDEIVILNSIKAAFSYLGGIITYGVAWIFLEQSSGANLSPDNSVDFTKITTTMSAIGLLFVVMFHIGIPEVRKNSKVRRKSIIIHVKGVHSTSAVYGLEPEDEQAVHKEPTDFRRKTGSGPSELRKLSTLILPIDAEMLQYRSDNPTVRCENNDEKGSSTDSAVDTIKTTHRVRKTAVYKRPPGDVTDPLGSVPPIPEDMDKLQEIQNDVKVQGSIGEDESCDDYIQVSNRTNIPVEDSDLRSKPEEISSSQDQVQVKDVGHVKGVKDWLKDPRLYKVIAIFTSAYSLENLTLIYLALYLMDHLRFEKEAAAYFSITYLVSGCFGSAICNKLIKTIGRKWTFCTTACLAIVTATWFYFVTESTKQMVYVPIVLLGCCASPMTVMGLSYTADLAGENTESSGFVFSFATATLNATMASIVMLIQSFYPSGRRNCQSCGDYVRMVYPLSIGCMSLIGLLVVLFSEFISLPCSGGKRGQPSKLIVFANPLTEDARVSTPPETTEVTEWNTRF